MVLARAVERPTPRQISNCRSAQLKTFAKKRC